MNVDIAPPVGEGNGTRSERQALFVSVAAIGNPGAIGAVCDGRQEFTGPNVETEAK